MAKKQVYATMNYTKKESIIFTIALGTLFISGIYVFGLSIVYIALVSYATMFFVEFIFQRSTKKKIGTSIYYLPLIYVLLLPSTIPLWIVFVGAFFISFFGKGVFGGNNSYVIHPVVVGILFITISFPAFLGANWIDPITNETITNTPIIYYNFSNLSTSLWYLLNGFTPGAIGVTSRLLILILAFFLMIGRITDFKIVISYLVSTILFTYILGTSKGIEIDTIYLSIFVGNVLFVSIFVATDPPTIPLYLKGKILYGIGLGFLTVLIRLYSAFPEGALFAVVIMNAVSPLLDKVGVKDE